MAQGDYDLSGNILKVKGIDFTGATIGTGEMVQTSVAASVASTHSLKVLVNGTPYYIPLNTSQTFA